MPDDDITIDDSAMGPAVPSRGESGGGIGSPAVTTTVKNDDGEVEVTVNQDGSVEIYKPAIVKSNWDQDRFDANLAERIDEVNCSAIAAEQVEGVEADILTRSDLIDQYEKGMDLLGTKVEEVVSAASGSRSISRIGHPLLLESMIKGHAGMESELLPAEGPAKVMTVGQVDADTATRAQDFADDFNYYLTEIAPEYYPDTSAMIMHLMYCGQTYKKIYRCPMRRRPVSEMVSMLDMIVSDEATDLMSAQRVTHQIMMSRSQLRRMQIAGAYLDVNLGWSQAMSAPGHDALRQSAGLGPSGQIRPQDVPYCLWETDMDLDVGLSGIDGKWEQKAPPGLPLPYKITVDQASRQILGVRRNWKDGDPMYQKRNMYVRYGLVPSMTFHHWGFLHLLGNHTKALRAIWRLMIDAGMFANFPGGAKLRGARTQTNEIAPNPGEFVDIDAPAGVTDIRQVLMALPYKSIDAVYVQLAQIIEEGAQRLGGVVMLESGEGRTNVPVGTIMSMIEQQTQVMSGVHKRAHRSQRDELRLMRELFAENPEDLWKLARDPKREWAVATEFMDLNLVPASDPNVPAQVHRIMQAWALMMIAQANPQMYDIREVNMRVLKTIRVTSPETLLLTPAQLAANAANMMGGNPAEASKMAGIQAKTMLGREQQAGRAALADKNAKVKMTMAERSAQQKDRDAAAKREAAQLESQLKAEAAALESKDRQADRESRERQALIKEDTERMKLDAEHERHAHDSAVDQAKDANDSAAEQARHQHDSAVEQSQHAHDSAAEQARHDSDSATETQRHAEEQETRRREQASRERPKTPFDEVV